MAQGKAHLPPLPCKTGTFLYSPHQSPHRPVCGVETCVVLHTTVFVDLGRGTRRNAPYTSMSHLDVSVRIWKHRVTKRSLQLCATIYNPPVPGGSGGQPISLPVPGSQGHKGPWSLPAPSDSPGLHPPDFSSMAISLPASKEGSLLLKAHKIRLVPHTTMVKKFPQPTKVSNLIMHSECLCH